MGTGHQAITWTNVGWSWVSSCGFHLMTVTQEMCKISILEHYQFNSLRPSVSDLTSIGSDNGLSPGRRQAIVRTNAGILLIRPLGTNFSEIIIETLIFSFKKIRLKESSAKRRPFCLGLNELSFQPHLSGTDELKCILPCHLLLSLCLRGNLFAGIYWLHNIDHVILQGSMLGHSYVFECSHEREASLLADLLQRFTVRTVRSSYFLLLLLLLLLFLFLFILLSLHLIFSFSFPSSLPPPLPASLSPFFPSPSLSPCVNALSFSLSIVFLFVFARSLSLVPPPSLCLAHSFCFFLYL